jgi:hypothetical protein
VITSSGWLPIRAEAVRAVAAPNGALIREIAQATPVWLCIEDDIAREAALARRLQLFVWQPGSNIGIEARTERNQENKCHK